MNNVCAGSFQSKIGTIAGEASVISKTFGVITKVAVVVGVVVAAVSENYFALAVPFKTGTGDYVEHSVGAIAVICGVSAALHFEIVNVLRIELRSNVRGNAGIWHWHSIDQPGNLVTSANVQLIVDHVSAGCVVGDHGQTVGLVGTGSLGNLLAAYHTLRGG